MVNLQKKVSPRIGIVGAGFIARVHARGLIFLKKYVFPSLNFSGVYDIDEEKSRLFYMKYGFPLLKKEEIIRKSDALILAIPPEAHKEWINICAEHGIVFYIEKPVGSNFEETREIANISEKIPHQVGLVLRFSPVVEYIMNVTKTFIPSWIFLRHQADKYGVHESHTIGNAVRRYIWDCMIHDVDFMYLLSGGDVRVTDAKIEYGKLDRIMVEGYMNKKATKFNMFGIFHEIPSYTSRFLEIYDSNHHIRANFFVNGDLLSVKHLEGRRFRREFLDMGLLWRKWVEDEIGNKIKIPSRVFKDSYTFISLYRFVKALYEGKNTLYPSIRDVFDSHYIADFIIKMLEAHT